MNYIAEGQGRPLVAGPAAGKEALPQVRAGSGEIDAADAGEAVDGSETPAFAQFANDLGEGRVVDDLRSVDDYTGRSTGAGGVIVVHKMAVPGVGWLVYAKDSEGNIFGILQSDPTAK